MVKTPANSKFDPAQLSRAERLELIAQLQEQDAKDKAATLVRLKRYFEGLCETEGVTLREVIFGEASPKSGPKPGYRPPIKYRDNNGHTWAGRGRTPRWIIASGKPAETFRIKADDKAT